MKIRISDVLFDSIVDGPGLRTVLFVQGCSHHCPGCHNPKTWDKEAGKEVEVEKLVTQLLDKCSQYGISSFTFSGGEPFEQPEACSIIAHALKKQGINLWSYSGYTYEQIMLDPKKKEFFEQLDVLVDGRFILAEKSLTLRFKGSRNQRIIDVQKSLESGSMIEFELDSKFTPYQREANIYI